MSNHVFPCFRSLSYGAIGHVLGHELTHGFDTTGESLDVITACLLYRLQYAELLAIQSSVRKKMATVHLTTIPCEPNTAHMAHRMLRFCKIHPRTNNIVHAGFQGCGAFLCAFMSVFAVFARYAL